MQINMHLFFYIISTLILKYKYNCFNKFLFIERHYSKKNLKQIN